MLDWHLAGSVREDVSPVLAGYPCDEGDTIFLLIQYNYLFID